MKQLVIALILSTSAFAQNRSCVGDYQDYSRIPTPVGAHLLAGGTIAAIAGKPGGGVGWDVLKIGAASVSGVLIANARGTSGLVGGIVAPIAWIGGNLLATYIQNSFQVKKYTRARNLIIYANAKSLGVNIPEPQTDEQKRNFKRHTLRPWKKLVRYIQRRVDASEEQIAKAIRYLDSERVFCVTKLYTPKKIRKATLKELK